MKKITSVLRKHYDKLIILLLGFLGLATSCDPVAEYGTPNADFHFKGTVSNSANQAPIENIQVKVYMDDTIMISQSLTDNTGAYVIDLNLFPIEQQIKLSATDIDGSENGTFASKDTTFTLDISGLEGGDGHWYSGEADIVTDIPMNESTDK